MQERKLDILLTTFPYAGTSTGSSLCWDTAEWLIRECHRLQTDPKFTSRIHRVGMPDCGRELCDTPITLTRNRAVQLAREHGAQLLLMVDSDMDPDVHLHDGADRTAEPFLDVAIDAIFKHYDRGPLVVAAPYCGPPPHELPYVGVWEALANHEESQFKLRMNTRHEATMMAGLHEAAALATGLILFDMRIFDLVEPPYFFYEMKEPYHDQKESTEDICSTRDLGQACIEKLGYNPLRCAWSSWAGHNKTTTVKKPRLMTSENVKGKLRDALGRPEKAQRFIDISQLVGNNNRLLEVCEAAEQNGKAANVP